MAIILGRNNEIFSNDLASDDFLQVNCCGILTKITEEITTIRPLGRKDYQLIVLVNGSVNFKYNDECIHLQSNESILLPPNIKNCYSYSVNSDYMWLHFSGSSVNDIIENLSIKPYTKYFVPKSNDIIAFGEKIIKELQLKKVGYMYNCNGYLLNILTLLKRKVDNDSSYKDKNPSSQLIVAVENMEMHFNQNKSISEYADMCKLSSSRFIHLFTKETGVSPHQYIIDLRISHAKYLLNNTDLKISDIAHIVGYDDSLYFMRIFKKHLGLTPSQFKSSNDKKLLNKNNRN